MKNILAIILTAFIYCNILSLTGCDSLTKPHLSLTQNSPYTLYITDFDWSYGVNQVNKFTGDFETLDRKVFNSLQGKVGNCYIVMTIAHINKYGQSNGDTSTIGMIELSELNRYRSWEYWHKDGGIQKLLYGHMFPPAKMADSSSAGDTTVYKDSTKSHLRTDTSKKEYTFSFTSDQLYSDDEDRNRIDSLSRIDSGLFRIQGVVTAIHPSAGLIKVREDSGAHLEYLIHVYPYKASMEVTGKLLLALRVGCKIDLMCMDATGATEQLVSATITF